MIKALFTSATGMKAEQLVVDNTAHNLANANTTGFKRSQVNFQDLLYETRRLPGTETAQGLQAPTGLQIGSGVRPAANTKIFSEGVQDITDNPLDVAIQGQGFFRITLPNGELRYTRDGALRKNAAGEIVNSDGYLLDPRITIPQDAESVTIGTDGTVSVTTPASPTPSIIGQLKLIRFVNAAGLSSEGRNLYAETAASGPPTEATPGESGAGVLQQGFLERSNVEVVTEMVNLILAQRAYEFNTRSIKAADEMLSITNNMTR